MASAAEVVHGVSSGDQASGGRSQPAEPPSDGPRFHTWLAQSPLDQIDPGSASDWINLYHSAADAWPAFRIPPEVFAAYVRERVASISGADPAAAPCEIHGSDLYLACACARGDHQAIAAFDDHCLRGLDRVLGKLGFDGDTCAEIKQSIRFRVLVGDGEPPKILDYQGRGDLRGWVRVMAVRRALTRTNRGRREVLLDDDSLLQQVAVPGDLELDGTKEVYRQAFQHAFEAAMRALPHADRNVLRQHYVDGATIDELGALYRVHRSTAARRVERARLRLSEAVRARLQTQLAVQPHDLDSIMRLIRSQIGISLHALQRRVGR